MMLLPPTLSSVLRPLALALLAGAAILAGNAASAYELDRIIAVVDEDVILQSELDREMQTVRDQLRSQGTPQPPGDILQRQVIERLILQKIQLQLGEKLGVTPSEEEIDGAIERIAANNNVDLPEFRQILAREGFEFDSFREDIRKQMIIARLRQQEVENRIRVTDDEIRLYLANQERTGGGDIEYRLAHILVSTAAHSDSEAEQRLAEARQRLDAGEEFASVAASLSDGQQALEGGDLGWRKGGELPSLFADVVPPMEVGDISATITSPSGFHIIQLADKRAGEKVLVEQTKAQHILIEVNEVTSDEEARERLRQLTLRLEGGADFDQLARNHSDDRGSALEGGDLGWVSPGQMVPEFEKMMNRTAIDDVSPAFRSDFGWHILKVNDRRSYDGTKEVRRAKARAAIRQRKLDEEQQLWLKRMRDEAYVEFRTDP